MLEMVEKQIAVIKKTDSYLAFPSLVSLDNGDLLMAFRSGRNCYRDFPEALNLGYQHPHTDPRSETWIARSTDDGLTWTIEGPPRPRRLLDEDHANGIAYQDVGLTKLADGRILLTIFRWKYDNVPPPSDLATPVREEVPGAARPAGMDYDYSRYQPFRFAYCLPPVYAISDPTGRTWSPYKTIDVREPNTGKHWGIATRNGGVLLDDDTVGVPFYCGDQGTLSQSGCYLVKYHVSSDRWTFGTLLAESSDQISFEEPLVHRQADGSLAGYYRTTTPGYMFTNVSRDNGETWSKVVQTKVWGHPYAALTLQDNDILLAYGYRRDPMGIRLSWLKNGDVKSFDALNEMVIRDDGLDDDIGYPTLCLTSRNTIVLAYYFRSREDEDPTRYIAIERLNLNGWTP
jgi:hypothetical protein